MPDVVVLSTRTDRAQETVVSAIEEMLAYARLGKIVAVAAAVIWDDGDTGNYVAQSIRGSGLIGSAAILLHTMTERAMANQRPVPPSNPEKPTP